MRVMFSLFFVLLIGVLPGQAFQPDAPPPFDLAALLGDGVEIVADQPIVRVDRETRQIRYRASSDTAWQRYAYPPSAEGERRRFSQERRYGDLSYILTFTEPFAHYLLDPARATLIPAPQQCGDVAAPPGDGAWRIVQAKDAAEYHLCHTETGATLPLLADQPTSLIGSDVIDSGLLSTWNSSADQLSPDGAWYVFAEFVDPLAQIVIWAYNFAAAETQRLGVVQRPDTSHAWDMLGWHDDATPLIRIFPSGIQLGENAIFAADVRRTGSLRWVAGQELYRPAYNASTGQLFYPRPRINPDPNQSGDNRVDIYRHDLNTDETLRLQSVGCGNNCLYRRMTVSPNGSAFAELIGYHQSPSFPVRVCLLAADATDACRATGSTQSGRFPMWGAENHLLLVDTPVPETASEPFGTRYYDQARIMMLATAEDGSPAFVETETDLSLLTGFAPDGRRLIVRAALPLAAQDSGATPLDPTDLDPTDIEWFDIVSGERRVLLHDVDTVAYRLGVSWLSADELRIDISEGGDCSRCALGSWIVRLPAS
ncbi:MAG: hypothetical protein GYB67_18950 [Chloroflexi bacterium]|nr:hypothetical protein [Chloroflexota bacterium]